MSGAIVRNSAWDASVRQVEEYLKENLNDPSSYQAIDWSPVQKTGGGYAVRHKYRAKNAYGALVIANQIFFMDGTGKVIESRDYSK